MKSGNFIKNIPKSPGALFKNTIEGAKDGLTAIKNIPGNVVKGAKKLFSSGKKGLMELKDKIRKFFKGAPDVEGPHAKTPHAPDTPHTKAKQKQFQNDEGVVNKGKTHDGHELKVDEHGNIAKCSECKVYELSHKKELDANPELKKELQDIRKKMELDPNSPKTMKELEDFDKKITKKRFEDAQNELTNNPAKIDAAYADYVKKKKAKGQTPRNKTEWLDGKLNPKTGKRKGGYKNTMKGTVAEYHGDLHLQENGFSKLSHDGKLVDLNAPPQGKGLDGIWEKNGEIFITDTKFNTAKLSELQKSKKWLQSQINAISDPALRARVQQALNTGKLKKMVVHVDPDGMVTFKDWK